MNFIKLVVSSGLGASLALSIYSVLVFLFRYGSVSLPEITPVNLAIGTIFGVLYALVRIGKPLSLALSAVLGIGVSGSLLFIASVFLVSVELSLFSLTIALLMGLSLGLGASLGVHIGKLSSFNH